MPWDGASENPYIAWNNGLVDLVTEVATDIGGHHPGQVITVVEHGLTQFLVSPRMD